MARRGALISYMISYASPALRLRCLHQLLSSLAGMLLPLIVVSLTHLSSPPRAGRHNLHRHRAQLVRNLLTMLTIVLILGHYNRLYHTKHQLWFGHCDWHDYQIGLGPCFDAWKERVHLHCFLGLRATTRTIPDSAVKDFGFAQAAALVACANLI
jgi:hypothetical protein